MFHFVQRLSYDVVIFNAEHSIYPWHLFLGGAPPAPLPPVRHVRSSRVRRARGRAFDLEEKLLLIKPTATVQLDSELLFIH